MVEKITKSTRRKSVGLFITAFTLLTSNTSHVYGVCYCSCLLMVSDTEMRCQSDQYNQGKQSDSTSCFDSCFGFGPPVIGSYCLPTSQIESVNKCDGDIKKCAPYQALCIKDPTKCEEAAQKCAEALKK